ncbi:MAG: bifunctional UDP-N-acetylglucosamine diphosphorylase/glucosamine-1-phosphate N-acetyltransferase GlmU [Rhodospirillaceae bacterium]|jgi:bifunctional UDP-N-acetylglucosamine pyrophosphorylase/glucosamine-1-phosphate N-acetyltransferase|nr:bifunctional UDP-N-acetylglucosamine diphosphorylase/glucosamine-1-phosphate N-acetyltransferase GlmU [Rhodospirillaceae bacterium]
MTTESTARRPFHAVILAGGRGTRMQSTLPKLLHPIAGRALLQWVIDAAQRAGAASVTVVLPPNEPLLNQACSNVQQVVQPVPLGTGDALRCAMPMLVQDDLPVAVIYGDTPFLQAETIGAMIAAVGQANSDARQGDTPPAILLLATRAAEPNAYSRLLMDAGGQVTGLVEWLDASPVQRALPLSFAGAMALQRQPLAALLAGLDNHNAKQEFYLTQLVALANGGGLGVRAHEVAEAEIMGINTQAELAQAESLAQDRLRAAALAAGVRMAAPTTVFFSADTQIAAGCVVEPHVVFGGGVTVAAGCHIKAFCYLEDVTLATGVEVGPFARLGPDATLGAGVVVGNFVEVKRARLGAGVKAKHLAYLGNVQIGAGSNIAAGVVVCNYNGFSKSTTVIGAGAFVGSNSVLIAPLTIGDAAYVAAGSTITDPVPNDALAIGRSPQVTKPDGATRLRQKYSKKS